MYDKHEVLRSQLFLILNEITSACVVMIQILSLQITSLDPYSVLYFEKRRSGWIPMDGDFLIFATDIKCTLPSPTIQQQGNRLYYHWPTL